MLFFVVYDFRRLILSLIHVLHGAKCLMLLLGSISGRTVFFELLIFEFEFVLFVFIRV